MSLVLFLWWLGITQALLGPVFGTKTVTLEPLTGPVCPGQDVILTCTVAQTGAVIETILNWRHGSSSVRYDSAIQQPGPLTLDNLITTAVFMISTNSTIITSNATLTSATLSNNNAIISCFSPPQDNSQTATIIVAGSDGMPFGLQITASASLTWLPPNTKCTFNYTVNITNSSCSMTVYSNSTSLILIDELIGSAYDSSWAERVVQLTREQNYSFAVAVTDSTGQNGPWSDQLRVMWDVPGSVFNINWRLNQTIIVVDWDPPSSPTHLPVLYYTVTHNVSDNGSELAFNTTTNEAVLNAGSHYRETYFISVCAVNAVGKSPHETLLYTALTNATDPDYTTVVFTKSVGATQPACKKYNQNDEAITVAVLSSAVLSIIGATLITSLVWCCAVIKMRKTTTNARQRQAETISSPFQGNISLQENVAYGQVEKIKK